MIFIVESFFSLEYLSVVEFAKFSKILLNRWTYECGKVISLLISIKYILFPSEKGNKIQRLESSQPTRKSVLIFIFYHGQGIEHPKKYYWPFVLLLRIVCSVHYWLVVFTGGIINLGVAKSSRLSCRLLCWFALSFMPSRLSAVGLLPWLPQHFPGSLGLHLIVLSPLFPRQLSHFRSHVWAFGPLLIFV